MNCDNRRCVAIEEELHRLKVRLETAVTDGLKYIADSERCGHPHGYSVATIPDWEARRILDSIKAALEDK